MNSPGLPKRQMTRKHPLYSNEHGAYFFFVRLCCIEKSAL